MHFVTHSLARHLTERFDPSLNDGFVEFVATVDEAHKGVKLPRKGKFVGETSTFKRTKIKYRADLRNWLRVIETRGNRRGARALATKALTRLYTEAYVRGLQASGAYRKRPLKSVLRELTDDDHAHVKRAVDEQVDYLMEFALQVLEERGRLKSEVRLRMYVEALAGFYSGARVAAFPDNSLIEWVGPRDERKCPSCTFLIKNSPYTKESLPASPRDGSTLCRANCRDKLRVKRGTPTELTAAAELPRTYFTDLLVEMKENDPRTKRGKAHWGVRINSLLNEKSYA